MASDTHAQNNKCEESLKKVHGCMELMANKLGCVFDMMAAKNVGTKGMYRYHILFLRFSILSLLMLHLTTPCLPSLSFLSCY